MVLVTFARGVPPRINVEIAVAVLVGQAFVGDPTDGYPGCPGVGPGGRFVEYAPDILEADRDELWDLVLMAYGSKEFTEEDAILQARMAHILRATSYNFKTKKIRLWQPFWLDD